MKISKIHIENYGCIFSFDYSFSKIEENIFRPLILIGKNGSGKTLVLSALVDSLIEIKRNFYPDTLKGVDGFQFFSMESTNLIQNGKSNCYSFIGFDNQKKYLDLKARHLVDIRVPKEIDPRLVNANTYFSTEFSKKVEIVDRSNAFTNEVFLYFPFDRYYIPNWENKEDTKIKRDNFDALLTNHPRSTIIKNNVCENLKEWLYRLFGISASPYSNPPSKDDIDCSIKECLNEIVQIIWGAKSHIERPDRKGNSVPLVINNVSIPDINNLSSGEIMVFSIFASIVKEYDLYHHCGFTSKDISGICIIDEIDMNLNISQQMNALPELLALFPKIQFIITTHNLFFVKGLFSKTKEVDIIEMPFGKTINDLIDFSEMKEAIDTFIPEGKTLLEKIQDAESKIEKLNSEKLPLILTEGKTDTKFIKKAYEKLGFDSSKVQFMPENISFTGDRDLLGYLKYEAAKRANPRILIGIFDHDDPKILGQIGESITALLSGHVFAFCIPIPESRKDQTPISIEHYFSDNELMTKDQNGRRLYEFGEFNSSGKIKQSNDKKCEYIKDKILNPNYILNGSINQKTLSLDGKTNYSLSKNDFFYENVINDVTGYNSFDFTNFTQIINLISQCIERAK